MRFVKIELILVLMLDTFPLIGFRTLSPREFWEDRGLRSNLSVAACLVPLFLCAHCVCMCVYACVCMGMHVCLIVHMLGETRGV